jgi:anti-sigma factor RsiW
MVCQQVKPLIDGYIDGEVDLVRHLEIEDHLKGCALCTQIYNDREVIRSAFKEKSMYFKASADLKKRVQNSVSQAAKIATVPQRPPWWWLKVAAPMAAAVLVVLTVIPLLRRPEGQDLLTQEVVSSHIRSLMANHLADVASSDHHVVKPWFNGKLDFSPPVEDLAQQGFPLVGGRLDYLDGRPVAALVYRRDKHVVNVFVWPSNKSVQAGTPSKAQQGYNVFGWTRSGMNFWVVSDLERSQLEQFIELLKAAGPTSSS